MDTAVVAVLILMVSECPVCFVTVPLSVTTDIVAFLVERVVGKNSSFNPCVSARCFCTETSKKKKTVTNVISFFFLFGEPFV